jgi:hypothetical protein
VVLFARGGILGIADAMIRQAHHRLFARTHKYVAKQV